MLVFTDYKNPGDGAGPGEAAQGMCRWDDSKSQLVKVGAEWPRNATLSLNGAHTVQRLSPTDANASPKYVWYVNGFVSSRVPADAASIADFSKFVISLIATVFWSSFSIGQM